MEKIWPTLEHVDSSSGALGSAVNKALDALIPILVNAPADGKTRDKWLDRLWQAMADDGSDDALRTAVVEMGRGLIDADLGGHVMKKRMAIGGRGKRGGVRTLLAYKSGDKAFFVYGFAKNVWASVRTDELKALKHLAKELMGYSDKALTKAIRHGALIEVEDNG